MLLLCRIENVLGETEGRRGCGERSVVHDPANRLRVHGRGKGELEGRCKKHLVIHRHSVLHLPVARQFKLVRSQDANRVGRRKEGIGRMIVDRQNDVIDPLSPVQNALSVGKERNALGSAISHRERVLDHGYFVGELF